MFGFAILVFLGLGFWRYRVNHVPGVWTTEKEALYRYGIQHIQDPARLAQMADHFEREGFRDRAVIFRERAKLVRVSGESQTNFSNVMRKALTSQNPDTVRIVAAKYEKSGRGASAEMLRSYANGLEAAKEVRAGFGYGNVLGAGANFGSGGQFGIGAIIPSTYIPPGSQKPKAHDSEDLNEAAYQEPST